MRFSACLIPTLLGAMLFACDGYGESQAAPVPSTPATVETPSAPAMPPMPAPAAVPSAAPAAAPAAGGGLDIAGVVFDIPEDWVAETPTSSMRLAQMSLPGEAGPAELSAFCFGTGQGGPVQANIDRWIGQFSNADNPGEPVHSDTETFEVNGVTVHIVTAHGTYSPGMGPMMQAGEPRPNHALYGVIVEGSAQGTVFAKIAGPAETMAAQQESLERFARSARLAQ